MSVAIGFGVVLVVVIALAIHLVLKAKKEKSFYTPDTDVKYTRINGGIVVTEKQYRSRNEGKNW